MNSYRNRNSIRRKTKSNTKHIGSSLLSSYSENMEPYSPQSYNGQIVLYDQPRSSFKGKIDPSSFTSYGEDVVPYIAPSRSSRSSFKGKTNDSLISSYGEDVVPYNPSLVISDLYNNYNQYKTYDNYDDNYNDNYNDDYNKNYNSSYRNNYNDDDYLNSFTLNSNIDDSLLNNKKTYKKSSFNVIDEWDKHTFVQEMDIPNISTKELKDTLQNLKEKEVKSMAGLYNLFKNPFDLNQQIIEDITDSTSVFQDILDLSRP